MSVSYEQFLLSVARTASDNGAGAEEKSVRRAGADGGRSGSRNLRQVLTEAQTWSESDWDKLLAMAAAHGVRPMLYRFLTASGNSAIPDRVIATLQVFTQHNLNRNLGLTGELIRLLRRFDERGLDVIPYKGPTLAALAYGDLWLREFADLDLLIARADFEKAQELLMAEGYQPEILLNGGRAKTFARACNVMAFWDPVKEISVELHWELSPKYLPFSPDFERLRQRMVPSHPGGQRIMTLSQEDLLVYLCAHGAKHVWERLSWIVDVASLIGRHSEINWDIVRDRAAEQRCERVLLLGLRLARDVAGVELPVGMEELIGRDRESGRMAAKVIQWLFQEEGSTRGYGEQTSFLLGLHRWWPDKIRSLARLTLTPSVADWMSYPHLQNYPALYPFLRPLRLVNKLTRFPKEL
jgi:hypothetical protein